MNWKKAARDHILGDHYGGHYGGICQPAADRHRRERSSLSHWLADNWRFRAPWCNEGLNDPCGCDVCRRWQQDNESESYGSNPATLDGLLGQFGISMADLESTVPDAAGLLKQHFSIEPLDHEEQEEELIEEELIDTEPSHEGFDPENVPFGWLVYGKASTAHTLVYSRYNDDFYCSWMGEQVKGWRERMDNKKSLKQKDQCELLAKSFREFGFKAFTIDPTEKEKCKYLGGSYKPVSDKPTDKTFHSQLGKSLYQDMVRFDSPAVKKTREKRAKKEQAVADKGRKFLAGATKSLYGKNAGPPSNAEDEEQCKREWEVVRQHQKPYRDGDANDQRPDAPDDMTGTERMVTDRTNRGEGQLAEELSKHGRFENARQFVKKTIELAKESDVTPDEAAPDGIGNPSKVFVGFIVLYQFLISLEEIGMSSKSSAPPCSFVDLELVILYFTGLPLALLSGTATNNHGNTTLDNHWEKEWHQMLGVITGQLARRLMLQCARCFRRVSVFAKVFSQACMFHLDHDTTRYVKKFSLAAFRSKLPKPKGYVKQIILECFKLRGVMCTFCHELGKGKSAYDSRRKRERVLIYGPMSKYAFPNKTHLTLKEVFQIKQFAKLITDWWIAGAWSKSSIPRVSFEYLTVSLWTQLGICILDVSLLTKEEYSTEVSSNRVNNMTYIIANVAIKLSGGCLEGCPECLLNIVPACRTGIPFNHKLPKNKVEGLCELKYNIWAWIEEAVNGDCDPNCDACHALIPEWQRFGGEKPAFYDGN